MGPLLHVCFQKQSGIEVDALLQPQVRQCIRLDQIQYFSLNGLAALLYIPFFHMQRAGIFREPPLVISRRGRKSVVQQHNSEQQQPSSLSWKPSSSFRPRYAVARRCDAFFHSSFPYLYNYCLIVCFNYATPLKVLTVPGESCWS